MPILIIRLYASKYFNVEENKRELDVPLKHLNDENLVCENEEKPTKDADAGTPEKRSARLATESIAKRQQRVSETDSQRMIRLQQLTSSRENRIASESNDQRAARLHYKHQRQSQSDKISSETEQERAARLLKMSASQQDRISNETEQERAARLHCDTEQHRVSRTQFEYCTSSRSTSGTKETSEINNNQFTYI